MVRRRVSDRPRGGFALPFAVFGLALAGSLVAATFLMGLFDLRSGRAALATVEARNAADVALGDEVAGLVPADLARIPVDSTVPSASGAPAASVRRLSPHVLVVTKSAQALAGRVVRGAGLLVRLRSPEVVLDQALSTPGAVVLDPSAAISGAPPPSPLSCLDPARPAEPGPAQSAFSAPAYEDLAAWSAAATVSLGPGLTVTPNPASAGGSCLVTDPGNWGDPRDPDGACGLHYPVVYGTGDLVVQGGMGQGILVVDGDLAVEYGFEFRGVVLVGGTLRAAEGGAVLTGAVQAGVGSGGGVELEAGSVIAHSPCAVEESVLGLSELAPLGLRAWLTTY